MLTFHTSLAHPRGYRGFPIPHVLHPTSVGRPQCNQFYILTRHTREGSVDPHVVHSTLPPFATPAQAAATSTPVLGLAPSGSCILFLCSGPARIDDAQSVAARQGILVWPIDKYQGGESHNILRDDVRAAIRHACLSVEAGGSGLVRAAHLASPCRSFSPLRVDCPLRLVDDPMGKEAPEEFQSYIQAENKIIKFCAEIFDILVDRSCPVTWENPPDLSQQGTPWHWPERAHLASLWHTPVIARLRARSPMVTVTAAMCRFGSAYRKYFTILAPAYLQAALAVLENKHCPASDDHAHHLPAIGCTADGSSHAELSGRYPCLLNAAILQVLTWQPRPSGNLDARPGAVSHGIQLSPELAQAVSAARHQPAGFASLRNMDHASEEELWRTALPDVRAMAAALAPPKTDANRRVWDGQGDWRTLVPLAPPGDISLSQLIGSDNLNRWEAYLAKYQEAFDAVRAGREPRAPGEFVLREDDLPTWARGIVWDCEDPTRCQPVRASTATTAVRGARQLNRRGSAASQSN